MRLMPSGRTICPSVGIVSLVTGASTPKSISIWSPASRIVDSAEFVSDALEAIPEALYERVLQPKAKRQRSVKPTAHTATRCLSAHIHEFRPVMRAPGPVSDLRRDDTICDGERDRLGRTSRRRICL